MAFVPLTGTKLPKTLAVALAVRAMGATFVIFSLLSKVPEMAPKE